LLNKRHELLPNDTLTILCEGQVISKRKKSASSSSVKKEKTKTKLSEESQPLEDYSEWLDNEKLSDVVLVTNEGHELSAHKMVLSIRSPVFAAMFQHEMKENRENRVELTDVGVELADQFLFYLYNGTVDVIEPFASELLVLADKV